MLNDTVTDSSVKVDQDLQQVEPNLSFIAQNETVSTTTTPPTTTNMSPPPSRIVPQVSSRPSTLQLGPHRLTGSNNSVLLTPNDYNKLVLSTPELDEKLRGYTIVSNTTPTAQLQTPDLINSITNAIAAQSTNNITFATDGQPSPGVKILEELLNAHQQQQQQQQPMNSGNVPQYIIVPPEAQHILQQLSSSVGGEQRLISTTNSEQFNQIAQALQKVVSSSSTSTTNLDSQNQNQETLLTLLNNHTRMHLPQTIHSHSQDIHSRNRSISSSMDTSMNGNEESSNSSSTAASPMTTHLHNNTIVLGKIKDEPQHVPSLRSSGSSGSPLERINLEHNEVAKKEKKRERNRQAAQKCRTRKLTRIAELQKRVNELQDNNKHLSSTAERLKNDIGKLERQLHEHQTQGCTLVANTSVL